LRRGQYTQEEPAILRKRHQANMYHPFPGIRRLDERLISDGGRKIAEEERRGGACMGVSIDNAAYKRALRGYLPHTGRRTGFTFMPSVMSRWPRKTPPSSEFLFFLASGIDPYEPH